MVGDDLDKLIAEQIDFYRTDAAGLDAFLRSLLDPANDVGASYRATIE